MNKELSREFQHGLQEQHARRRRSAEQQAEQVADALDAYLETDASLRAAAAECYANNGVVIHDVIWQEQKQRDDTRAAFVKALVTFKGGFVSGTLYQLPVLGRSHVSSRSSTTAHSQSPDA